MIRLTRPNCPQQLLQKRAELISEYKATKKSVWKKRYIIEPLLEMSHDKCAFCECRLIEEGKYMQVEHFHNKSDYEDEVVDWENLLPICIRCNSHKLDHDTYQEEIIDPTKIDPKEHLCYSNFRILGKDVIGELTVEVLDLNDIIEIMTPRFQVAQAVLEKLSDTVEVVRQFNSSVSNDTQNARIIRKVKALLRNATPPYDYSAVVATTLLNEPDYHDLKLLMKDKELWTSEMEQLEMVADESRLPNKTTANLGVS